MVHVKICGVRSADDARECVRLGASAIGLNFVPSSVRYVDVPLAQSIARAIHLEASKHGKVLVVGVVANMTDSAMRALVAEAELDCLQLHGNESPELLASFLPHAYKAVPIASAADVAHARTYPGEHLLVDAKVEGELGGTGTSFDWSLIAELARERQLTLAGGLNPDNVGDAVRQVRPYCVDVASGVESAPGKKDLGKIRDFINRARHGARAVDARG